MSINISEIVSRYPKLEPWHTGGGCMALRLDLENAGYLLITDCTGLRIPESEDDFILCGAYDNEGSPVDDPEEMKFDVNLLSAWIQKTLDAGQNLPGSVRAYFVSRLGQSFSLASDISKCQLDSAIGKDCKQAIDRGFDLIEALRVVRSDYSQGARQIREIVADTCNVIWRADEKMNALLTRT